MVSNGDEVGLLWRESWNAGVEQVRLTLLDADGVAIGTSEPLAGGDPEVEQPADRLVWTGATWAVVQTVNRLGEVEAYVQTVSSDLSLGLEVRLTTSESPVGGLAAVWLGASIGVVCSQSGEYTFFEADASSGVIPDTTHVLSAGQNEERAVSAAGRTGLVFSDGREGQPDVFFIQVDESGESLDPDGVKVAPTAGSSQRPLVAWTGDEFAIVWEEVASGAEGYETWLGAVDALGAPSDRFGAVLPYDGETGPGAGGVPDAYHAPGSLSWSGQDLFLVGLRGTSGGSLQEVFAVTLSLDGTVDADGLTTVRLADHDERLPLGAELRNAIGVTLSPTDSLVAWSEHHQSGESNCDGDSWTLRVAHLTRAPGG